MTTLKFSSVVPENFSISNVNGPVVVTSLKIRKNVKGLHGCQGDCKRFARGLICNNNNEKEYTTNNLDNMAAHMRDIVMTFSRARIQKMIRDNWVYCVTCSHAFNPLICPGKVRKICPCCTTRLNSLKTVLKRSTVQKIRDTVLISRVE